MTQHTKLQTDVKNIELYPHLLQAITEYLLFKAASNVLVTKYILQLGVQMSTSFKIEAMQLAQVINVYTWEDLRHSEIGYTAVSKAA